ncbi:hypothetical protein GQX74_008152 [Glossina fuscipes]|nr:hypothetical protein GQX74_008152 [Glossina fuscipes]
MFLSLITSAQAYKAIIGKLSYAPHVCLIPRAALPANKKKSTTQKIACLVYFSHSTNQAGITKSPFKTFTSKSKNKMLLSFNEQEALPYNVHFLNSFKCSIQI